MKKQSILRTAVGLALSFALSLIGTATFAEAAPSADLGTKYNYFSRVYPHLSDPSPVYQTVTYSQLRNLLDSNGTYVILFGGAWCGNTQPVTGFINEVAKEYGVRTIYNFDIKLDGKGLNIRDTKNPYANLYVDLVNRYLANITTIYDKAITNISYTDSAGKQVVASKLQVPFLFAYNKNHKDANGNSAPILASYEKMYVWDDFLTNGALDSAKAEAYKAQVRPVFDAISELVKGKKVARYDTFDNYAYYSTAFNTAANTTIIDESDRDFIVEPVTYHEVTDILGSEGNHVFLFGGSWCPNTRAVIKLVNQYAMKYNISVVYNFDTKLDSNTLHIRDTKNPYANLYVDLVNKYLTNITTEYDKAKTNISYTDASGSTIAANKLQVPFVFAYNKDHKDAAGNSAPILGSVELMYTWENIQPGYVDASGQIGRNYKAYTAALDSLFASVLSSVGK